MFRVLYYNDWQFTKMVVQGKCTAYGSRPIDIAFLRAGLFKFKLVWNQQDCEAILLVFIDA